MMKILTVVLALIMTATIPQTVVSTFCEEEEVVIETLAAEPRYDEPTTEAITTEAIVTEEIVIEGTEETEDMITEGISDELTYLGNFRCTAYCGCASCCGSWGNTTSTGAIPTPNHTIAVDPSTIPYGTQVVINGITYVAEDCGGGIRGNSIDIYFATHQEALNFGVQYLDVYRK